MTIDLIICFCLLQIYNTTVDIWSIWDNLQYFTGNNTYFGHEITDILTLQESLLQRQDNESKSGTEQHLTDRLNSTRIGTSILNDLIINNNQWNQIKSVIAPERPTRKCWISMILEPIDLTLKVERSNYALRLLNASEDLALRLSNAAASSNVSFRCDNVNSNITVGSFFWDGVIEHIADCNLENHTQDNVLQRFPLQGPSAILLPQSVLATNVSHTSAGFIISCYFLDYLLPGKNK